MNFLGVIISWCAKHPVWATVFARTLPVVVTTLDSWISTARYDSAVERVKDIAKHDMSLLRTIYNERKEGMSPGVRRAFEEALDNGGLI